MESFCASVIAWALFNIFSSPPPCFFFIPSIIVGWKVPDQNTASYHKRQSRLLCSSLWVPVSFVESPPLSFTPTTPKTHLATRIYSVLSSPPRLSYTQLTHTGHICTIVQCCHEDLAVFRLSPAWAHTHTHWTHISHDKAEEYEHGWGLRYGGTGAGL